MKYGSKQELTAAIRAEYESLQRLLGAIPRSRYHEADVWGDGWTIHDLVAHLTAWQQLFFAWYRDGLAGLTPAMPAAGYKWNETPRLNRDIWLQHRDRPLTAVLAQFEQSHSEVLELVDALSPDALLRPGHFAWTGPHPLTTYLGPNTVSHYRFASKVLKRWQKRQQ
jgi:hypothetical protein